VRILEKILNVQFKSTSRITPLIVYLVEDLIVTLPIDRLSAAILSTADSYSTKRKALSFNLLIAIFVLNNSV